MRLFTRIIVRLISCIVPAIASGAEPPPRSVLMLTPASPSSPFIIDLAAAFRSELHAASTAPVSIHAEHLDLARFGGAEYEDVLRHYIGGKHRAGSIGVIVAVGRPTLEFVLRARAELLSEPPVVFALIDEASAARFKLPSRVTGTTMRVTFRDIAVAARALVRDIKRIALVGDPLERQPARRQYKEQIPVFAADLDLIDLSGLPLSEVKTRISALPDDSAIVYTGITRDGAGVAYIAEDALAQIEQVARRPIVVDTEGLFGFGAAGGFLVSPARVGRQAARLALRILDGESPANIPIALGDFSRPVFDSRQLRRFGIDESRLPSGSEVRFREPTAWERYDREITVIAGALLLQSALIIMLLYERRRRRKAELDDRRHMSELAHMNRRATAGALSASIAHELNQPLAAISVSGNAGLRWLAGATPDLGEARAALQRVIGDSHRAES